ncbi:uncharacterized protein LOC124921358 [Impatiens glandulifera]|uniref:uncharacterized protein LOC124921358 n=1 Tax=Impatiens glandulifera TaxID=253017 RepID=UPI001FB09019|nr:uncharacterized protein LOC124921358 [Impatiens glandulifera]XP_047317964.1 uncharacterized protein LOC124921358 [Impatiens glandulifera]
MEITLLKPDQSNNNKDLLIKTSKLSISKARRSIEKSFVKLSSKIPRHIISIEEKYLRHCLELIYVTASLNNPSWEPISSKIPSFPAMTPMIRGHEDGEWIVGSITQSKSILNILKSSFNHKDETTHIRFDSGRIQTTKSRVSDSIMGMVQLTWKAGSPHCVFLLDSHKEVYTAKRSSDSVYVFHQSDTIVGRMRVSQTDSEIKETEFVLFGVDDDDLINVSKTQILKKKNNSGLLQRKINQVFKTNRSSIESNRDSCVWPRQEDDYFLPNLQLIAVVIKEQIHTHQKEEETKGWGLKFLRRIKKIKEENLDIDIVVPAGIHGGPRNKESGPSGLLERWRSAGRCDCEGWDMGCSFKVFKTRPTDTTSCSSQPRSCSSFDLFIEGSSESAAAIRITNVDDRLYTTRFESGISALQTFATAVAVIHCRSPQLKTQQDQDF